MSGIIKSVSVIGLGYIGLPTAAVFASRHVNVIGIDINNDIVDMVNSGNIHIVEQGLRTLVDKAVSSGYLHASTVPEPADAFLIAVPTPLKEKFKPDLSYVKAAALAVADVLKKGDIVILESTSPVGTTERMVEWLAAKRKDLKFAREDQDDCDVYVAYCPERVLPGQVLRELVENDRIIGGMNLASSLKAQQVYRVFVEGELLVTNARTAEMSKLTENAYRDANIAFANELSLICDKLDINVWDLIKLANHHPRVNILQPGPGVGGHCIAVDPWFIINRTPNQVRLIRTARLVNDIKTEWVIEKVSEAVAAQVAGGKKPEEVRIACFGLAFKADIDDLRESPALEITLKLARLFPGRVMAVEPNLKGIPESLRDAGVAVVDYSTALLQANVLALLVEHAQFRVEKPELAEDQLLVDTRGIWGG